MSEKHIDRANLTVTGRQPSGEHRTITVEEGVVITVNAAYGPDGDNLVGISNVSFDGHPAITVHVKAGDREGLVHLSPIHGDRRKEGFTDIAAGTKCDLYCSVSGKRLDLVGAVEDGSGADYYAIYLTTELSEGAMAMVSDVWGHHHSRLIDDFALISYWARSQD